MSSKQRPTPEELLRLHTRLLAGSASAWAELSAAVFDELIALVRQDNPRIDESLCRDAAADALTSLFRNPSSFDPARARQGLMGYLRMAAGDDLRNLLRKERRHRNRCIPLFVVEDSPLAGKYLGSEDEEPSHQLSLAEQRSWLDSPALQEVIAQFSAVERCVFEFMCEGERRTNVIAAAIGLAALPMPQQKREVKRIRDRIIKRLERAGGGREQSA